ncbi:MAG: hypothetical protein ACOC1P_01125 [Minisyncoccales bacterium]
MIKVTIMLEILGRPPEHIQETLEGIINKIDAEKSISVINKKIKEPKLIEGKDNLYTAFAEVDLEVEYVMNILFIVFKYMPSYVEITEPEKLYLKNSELNETFNELTRRLHSYDETARILQMEKKILEDRLKSQTPSKKYSEESNSEESDSKKTSE